MAKRYNRIMLGRGGMYADQCRKEGFIGVDFLSDIDFSDRLTESLQEFNKTHVPLWLKTHPDKSKTSAGLSCGFTWTVCKGLQNSDVVLSPNGRGEYYVGTIESGYYYVRGEILPHRRKVNWLEKTISKKQMSEKLQNSIGSIGTCCDVTKYANEIEALIGNTFADTSNTTIKTDAKAFTKTFSERSLHALFCTALRNRNIYAKTIFHEKSSGKSDSAQKWVHPDIIGVEIDRFENEKTLAILKATEPREAVKLYSFELKKSIDSDSHLKQYYFQALSNSNWANYGYLVAYEISENLNEEMGRLNAAFGIGVILMNSRDYQILFPAKERSLDYNTIEKLNNLNKDFESFLLQVSNFITAEERYINSVKSSLVGFCDPILQNEEEIEYYCSKNNIPY